MTACEAAVVARCAAATRTAKPAVSAGSEPGSAPFLIRSTSNGTGPASSVVRPSTRCSSETV